MDVIWEQRGDVWAPTRVSWTVDFGNHPTENRLITLDWKSVNQPVPASRFDWRTIPLAPGTMVGDSRLDHPNVVLVETIPDPATAQAVPKLPASSPRRGSWLIIANLVVLGVIILAWTYQRWKRKTA